MAQKPDKPKPAEAPLSPARATSTGHVFRVASLSSRKPTRFRIEPDAETRSGMAELLGLLDLPLLRLRGEIAPAGARDFLLTAELVADIVQPCSITLAPVPAQISEKIERRYLADWAEPEGDEVEMPEDDSTEPLPEVIDLHDVAIEALALALPQYPRAPGVELGEASFAPPGAEPIREADLKPFAALAQLKDKLDQGGAGQ